jgi:hypothetical protein
MCLIPLGSDGVHVADHYQRRQCDTPQRRCDIGCASDVIAARATNSGVWMTCCRAHSSSACGAPGLKESSESFWRAFWIPPRLCSRARSRDARSAQFRARSYRRVRASLSSCGFFNAKCWAITPPIGNPTSTACRSGKWRKSPSRLADPTLNPAAGACVTCPRRSGYNTSLFSDVTDGDQCLSGPCYQIKLTAYIDREIAARPELIQIENGWRNAREQRPGAVQRGHFRETLPLTLVSSPNLQNNEASQQRRVSSGVHLLMNGVGAQCGNK